LTYRAHGATLVGMGWPAATVLIALAVVTGLVVIVALRERSTAAARMRAEVRATKAEERWEEASIAVLELRNDLAELRRRLDAAGEGS
jgi:Tfp pilus assembly protein PilO